MSYNYNWGVNHEWKQVYKYQEVRGSTNKYKEVNMVGSLEYKKLTIGLPPNYNHQ